MSSLDLVCLQVRALELKLGVERGGFRFWLFVFNWLASLGIVIVLCAVLNWIIFVYAVLLAFVIIIGVDFTKIWNGLGK